MFCKITEVTLLYLMQDILTDLVVERAPVCFNGIHGTVHTGMFQSAKYIRNKLIHDGTLDLAFRKAKVSYEYNTIPYQIYVYMIK